MLSVTYSLYYQGHHCATFGTMTDLSKAIARLSEKWAYHAVAVWSDGHTEVIRF